MATTRSGASASDPLAVVIPVFNPGARLRPVVEGVLQTTPLVYVVDDGTTDGGVEPIRELPVRIERFERNRGKGYALVAGYRAALEDAAVQFVAVLDADGQHDPKELPNLYAEAVARDADLLIGSRDFGSGHVPLRSRFGNRVTVAATSWLLGTRLQDTQSGYRILSRRFLERALEEVTGGRYETEMELLCLAIREGFAIESVSIATIYESGNPSSHFRKLQDSFRIYRTLFRAAAARRRGPTSG